MALIRLAVRLCGRSCRRVGCGCGLVRSVGSGADDWPASGVMSEEVKEFLHKVTVCYQSGNLIQGYNDCHVCGVIAKAHV